MLKVKKNKYAKSYSNPKWEWNRGRRGTAPIKEAPAVYGSGEFLYAYGTQANANQIELLGIYSHFDLECDTF